MVDGPWPKMNTQVSALRFLFKTTLGRLDLAHQLARVNYSRKLPRGLSPEDVTRLLEAAPGPGLKYKAALSVAHGSGLRRSEVVASAGPPAADGIAATQNVSAVCQYRK